VGEDGAGTEAGMVGMVLLAESGAVAWQAPSALAKQNSQVVVVRCMPKTVRRASNDW
jgi:hypothetical protein